MRKLAIFAGAFSATVFLWRYSLRPLALAAALLCCLGGLIAGRKDKSALRLCALLILSGTLFALLWSHGFYRLTLKPWEAMHKENLLLSARVDDFGYINDNGSLVLEAQFTDPESGKHIDGRLYLPDGNDVVPGDVLLVRGTLYLADHLAQRELTYFSSRGTFVRFYGSFVLDRERPEKTPLRYYPLYAARYTEETLTRFFAEDTAPLARALVTGNKDGLDDRFQAMSRRAGLAHIIVISGMHVSIFAGFVAFLLGRRGRLSALLTLLLLCFFALMAGGTPSVWRAVFLHGAGLLAPLCNRENDPPTSLLTALMVLLLVNPYSVASVSLQLSFAAVAGIYLLTPILLNRWKPKGKRPASRLKRLLRRGYYVLASTMAVSLGAIAFTTPLVAYYFGTVSLIGPVSNLLTLWAVSDAFLLAVAAVLVGSFFPQAGFALAWVGNWLLRYLAEMTVFLGELPFAGFTTTSIYYAVGLAGLYGICCLHLFRPFGKQRLRVPVTCGLILVLSCIWFTRSEFRSGDMTVAVLDVGQGQSVVLHGAGRTIVVDCGSDEYTDAGHVVADYLADVGISKIDLLVLTHYHADHANGVPSLLRRMKVEAAAVPDVEPEDPLRFAVLARLDNAETDTFLVTETFRYSLDENTVLTLYAPLGSGSTNEQGLSVLMSAGSYDTLITGDMNSEVENRLVKYCDLPDIELLVVGHHGSRYSTGETLLDELRPETAIISVGEGNSYGHPADETLARLAKRNITIYRTDLSGTVVLHTSGKE